MTISPKIPVPSIKSAVGSHDSEARWLQVEFTKPMRVAWDWNDLMQNALTAGENRNLTIAGLVLSNNI